MNHCGLSSICVASYACPPLVKLYFFIHRATSFLSWSFPTKCASGFALVLLNPVIRWIKSIVISTLRSNHRCPPCTHDNRTFKTALISLLQPRWGICNKFNNPDGYSEAIQACGVSASTFVAMFMVITMY